MLFLQVRVVEKTDIRLEQFVADLSTSEFSFI